jgi:L-fuconolactonase
MPPVLQIDTHQHFWMYDEAEYGWIDDRMTPLRRDFLPADARREMDTIGVDTCVAVQARQTLDETTWLLGLADQFSFIAGVVGWVDLQAPDVGAQLERVANHPRLVGVRHIVQGEPDGFLDRPAFRHGISQLEPLDLTYDILVYARQLADAIRFARAFPRQRFVLDHLGKPDVRGQDYQGWRGHLNEIAALPNVCCKLSGLVTEADWDTWTRVQLRPYLDAALESFGPERLMIGSDWPVCTLAGTYKDVIGVTLDAIAEYSVAERERMLGGTARDFWRIGLDEHDADTRNGNRAPGPGGGLQQG